MKKINTDGQLTVKEFLQLEDGYYNLENPIEYIAYKPDMAELFQTHLDRNTFDHSDYTEVLLSEQAIPTVQLAIGKKYHVKLEFDSGYTTEGDVEAVAGSDSAIGFSFNELLEDSYNDGSGMSIKKYDDGTYAVVGVIQTTLSKEDSMNKYSPVTITLSEDGISSVSGEISGVINVHTDVKVMSGVTKIITTCADDTSYYIENVWQDGEILEVSAMDEASGEDEGDDKQSGNASYKLYFERKYENGAMGRYELVSSEISGEELFNAYVKGEHPTFIIEATTVYSGGQPTVFSLVCNNYYIAGSAEYGYCSYSSTLNISPYDGSPSIYFSIGYYSSTLNSALDEVSKQNVYTTFDINYTDDKYTIMGTQGEMVLTLLDARENELLDGAVNFMAKVRRNGSSSLMDRSIYYPAGYWMENDSNGDHIYVDFGKFKVTGNRAGNTWTIE